jgi:predicted nucleotidyltransferase
VKDRPATPPDAAIDRALADTLGIVAAYVFGSVADGRAHRDSDIDIGILLERTVYPGPAERFDARLRLTGHLGSALGRNDVDLVILNDAPPHLARDIVTLGRRVVCRDAEADHAFRRTAMLRAADLEPFLLRARRVKLDAMKR